MPRHLLPLARLLKFREQSDLLDPASPSVRRDLGQRILRGHTPACDPALRYNAAGFEEALWRSRSSSPPCCQF